MGFATGSKGVFSHFCCDLRLSYISYIDVFFYLVHM